MEETHIFTEDNSNYKDDFNFNKSKTSIKQKSPTFSRLYSSSILIFLYSLQGLVIGLLLETLQMKLKENFKYSEIGVYLLCSYPFSLKILWSPFVDTFYLAKLGLRKTWVILTQSISSIILFYLSSNIDSILEEKKIYFLSMICLFLMFCIATQDIAVDGWALTLCGKENCSLASSCQTIGQVLGICISTSVYINLNNFDYLELRTYFFIVFIVFVIATVIVFFIKEGEDEDNEEHITFFQTMKKIAGMSKNKNLRGFIGIILLANIGNIFFNKVFGLVLIDKGLTQELLTNISTVMIPVELFFSYYLSHLKSNFLSKYLYSYKHLIFIYIAELLFLIYFDKIISLEDNYGKAPLIILILLLSFIKTCFGLIGFIAICGFFHRICDNKLGATYITTLNSVNNLSQKWPGIFIFALVDYFGSKLVAVISIVYCVFYYFTFSKHLAYYDSIEEKEWKVVFDSDKKVEDSDKLVNSSKNK